MPAPPVVRESSRLVALFVMTYEPLLCGSCHVAYWPLTRAIISARASAHEPETVAEILQDAWTSAADEGHRLPGERAKAMSGPTMRTLHAAESAAVRGEQRGDAVFTRTFSEELSTIAARERARCGSTRLSRNYSYLLSAVPEPPLRAS